MPASAALPAFRPHQPPVWSRVWRWLCAAVAIHHERRTLDALDDHLLADIGLERHQVTAECGRAFWDIPTGAWRG